MQAALIRPTLTETTARRSPAPPTGRMSVLSCRKAEADREVGEDLYDTGDTPQAARSARVSLCAMALATGMTKPNSEPDRLIAAATLPSRISVPSAYGVTFHNEPAGRRRSSRWRRQSRRRTRAARSCEVGKHVGPLSGLGIRFRNQKSGIRHPVNWHSVPDP